MAKGEGAPPESFSCFSSEWEDLLLQTNFSAVRTSSGHPSTDKPFQIGPTVLALKLHTRRVFQGGTSILGSRGLGPKISLGNSCQSPKFCLQHPQRGLKHFARCFVTQNIL